MVKNKLEKMFSKSIKADETVWGMKLHNNPLSHQNTPGDYLLTERMMIKDLNGKICADIGRVYLVECKQCTCDENGKGRLAHNRLKQMHDMLAFENKFNGFHKAYWCIAFYNGGWAKSDVYIIPVHVMYNIIQRWMPVSFNRMDFNKLFKEYQIFANKGVLPLQKLKQ